MRLIKLKLKYKISKYVVPLLPPWIRIFMNGEFPISSSFLFACQDHVPPPPPLPFQKKTMLRACLLCKTYTNLQMICFLIILKVFPGNFQKHARLSQIFNSEFVSWWIFMEGGVSHIYSGITKFDLKHLVIKTFYGVSK